MGKITEYGFTIGPIEVRRIAELDKLSTITVEAGEDHLQITVCNGRMHVKHMDKKTTKVKTLLK